MTFPSKLDLCVGVIDNRLGAMLPAGGRRAIGNLEGVLPRWQQIHAC